MKRKKFKRLMKKVKLITIQLYKVIKKYASKTKNKNDN